MATETLTKAQAEKVKAEVKRLDDRVSGAEAATRLLVKVQAESLTKAERLRKAAVHVVRCHRDGRNEVRSIERLEKVLAGLLPFHKGPKYPPKWRKRAR